MSRRGWKSQREALFGGRDAPAASASEVWSDAPAARSRRGRARHVRGAAWFAEPDQAWPKDLVGHDLAEPPRRARARARVRLPIAIGLILGALLLVTLRVEILRLRYAAADVAAEEEALLEQIRRTTVRVRELRDPARLRRLAAERGFVRPERVRTLSLPAAPATAATRRGAKERR